MRTGIVDQFSLQCEAAENALKEYRFAAACQEYRSSWGIVGRMLSSRINTVDPLYKAAVLVDAIWKAMPPKQEVTQARWDQVERLRGEVARAVYKDLLAPEKAGEWKRCFWVRYLCNTQEDPAYEVDTGELRKVMFCYDEKLASEYEEKYGPLVLASKSGSGIRSKVLMQQGMEMLQHLGMGLAVMGALWALRKVR